MGKLTDERLRRRRLLRLERCINSMLDEGQAQYRRWLNDKIDQIGWNPAGREALSKAKEGKE